MVALYDALYLVMKYLFSKLNHFTFRDFSHINAVNTLSALVSASLYFSTQSFFANTRTCGLCNPDGRGTYAVFLLIGCSLFNVFYFGSREQLLRKKAKQVMVLAFPVSIVLIVWCSFVCYKIGMVLH